MSGKQQKLEPEISDGDMMIDAYISFLHWAITAPELLVRFKEKTGEVFVQVPRSGLEALIDAACNVNVENENVMLKFIVWVTETYWGEDMAPTFYFEPKKKGIRKGDAGHNHAK